MEMIELGPLLPSDSPASDSAETTVFLFVAAENFWRMLDDPKERARFDGDLSRVPIERMRLVSLNQIAQNTNLPLNIVQRSIHALKRRSWIAETAGGLYVDKKGADFLASLELLDIAVPSSKPDPEPVTKDKIGPTPTDLETRLLSLIEQARLRRDIPPSTLLYESFSDLLMKRADQPKPDSVPSLPKRAPQLWAKRKNKDETPPEFAARVYCVWMDAEVLTRPDLKRLDPQLFSSLDNWLKHNRRKAKPDPLPEGFKLLTIEQSNDSWVSKVVHGQVPFPTAKDELARFAVALYDRARGPRTK